MTFKYFPVIRHLSDTMGYTGYNTQHDKMNKTSNYCTMIEYVDWGCQGALRLKPEIDIDIGIEFIASGGGLFDFSSCSLSATVNGLCSNSASSHCPEHHRALLCNKCHFVPRLLSQLSIREHDR